MARSFNGSTQYLRVSTAVVSAPPLTLACWIYPTNVGLNADLITISSGGADLFGLFQGSDTLVARTKSTASGGGSATTAAGLVANTWAHVGGVIASTASRKAYLNGTTTATNTTAITNPTVNAFSVAQNIDVNYFNGRIAHAAVWSVALTDDEMLMLSKGFSPLLVRPGGLAGYWPLDGDLSPEPDRWRQNLALTLTAAPTKADGPRIYYPTGVL